MTLPQDLTPLVRDRLREPDGLPPPRIAEMGPLVHQTPQERGRFPRLDRGRFQTMFSATKFVLAGAIVALFGGFLLAGVLTEQPSDEPLPLGAASASPSPEVDASDQSVRSDLLPGVDLVTAEVEPGVYRVLSDGLRDLSHQVQDATVTPSGEVWVELGTSRDWDIIRLGEPGVSRELGRKDPWRLFSLDGAPAVEPAAPSVPWRVYDGDRWTDYEPSRCDDLHIGWMQGGITADGKCWTASGHAGLERIVDQGYVPVDPEEIGLGPNRRMVSATVTEDGTLWATVHASQPRGFEGLVRYDGGTWAPVPYDSSAEPPLDDESSWTGFSHLALGPDGTVWVVDVYGSSGPGDFDFLVRSWDGDDWTAFYAPVDMKLEPHRVNFLQSLLGGSMDARFFGDGRVWLLDGMLLVDADGVRSQELPVLGDPVFDLNGFAWTVDEGGLYVITPEAVTPTE